MRWLQLLIRGASGPVEILDVGVRRRLYDYPHKPDLKTSDATLNRVLGASINTHLNVGQDTCVDNIVRERQQYPDLYLRLLLWFRRVPPGIAWLANLGYSVRTAKGGFSTVGRPGTVAIGSGKAI